MNKLRKVTYSLKDVAIMPAEISRVVSRKDVNPFIKICDRESYPIFVAPMGAVTDENNYKVWLDNKLTPVVPRTVSERLSFSERMEIAKKTFVSFSLSESEEILNYDLSMKRYICIDLANGHMEKLIKICSEIKNKFGDNVIIMTGNIANPSTYVSYCNAHIDYVRVGIGDGSRCTTSANGGVHYSMASLLDDICEVRNNLPLIDGFKTKIVADGGIYNFDDINKALAIGADAVMIGRVFAECEEACGEVKYTFDEKMFGDGVGYTKEEYDDLSTFIKKELKPYRDYYGMSTKKAQKETGGNGDKTSEGISRPVIVKYPVAKWLDNMESYLRSVMSYTDSFTIEELNNNAQIVILGGSGDLSYRK